MKCNPPKPIGHTPSSFSITNHIISFLLCDHFQLLLLTLQTSAYLFAFWFVIKNDAFSWLMCLDMYVLFCHHDSFLSCSLNRLSLPDYFTCQSEDWYIFCWDEGHKTMWSFISLEVTLLFYWTKIFSYFTYHPYYWTPLSSACFLTLLEKQLNISKVSSGLAFFSFSQLSGWWMLLAAENDLK